jgi:O-antigen/teichoic acid export membrane protein
MGINRCDMKNQFLKNSNGNITISYGSISGSLLAKNTILNLMGMILPLLVGVVAIPFSIKGLGKEGFGVLSIAWVVLAYFGFFDFGLSRATTKFVSEMLGKKEIATLPSIVWTGLMVSFSFGVVGGIVLFVMTPYLIGSFFKIPLDLMYQAKISFYMLGCSIPIVLCSTSLRGVLGAAQRFDLVNSIVIPTSMLTFIFPALSFPFHLSLAVVIFLIISARTVAALFYLFFCFKVFPILKTKPEMNVKILKKMLSYGGWITITNTISPLLVYMDRFIIGSLISMSAVTFYTVPYELVVRAKVLPNALMTTIFPEFSAAAGNNNADRIKMLICRSFKYISITIGFVAIFLFAYAPDILNIWLGPDFREKSSFVFRILVIGVFINSLSFIPSNMLQGIGRPDLPAKFHLIELPLYLFLLWLFISKLGITGAALAWTIRILVDAVLLFGTTLKFYPLSNKVINENRIFRVLLLLIILLLFVALIGSNIVSFFLEVISLFLIILTFAALVWAFVFDETEKGLVFSKLNLLLQKNKA